MTGLALELFQPNIVKRSCTDCQKYMTDDDWTGQMGDFVKDCNGNRIERPPMSLPICRRGKPEESKCPKGTPENPRGLSERNRQFWEYLRLVRSAPAEMFPTDRWFWELVAQIEQIEKEARDARQDERDARLMATMLGAITGR